MRNNKRLITMLLAIAMIFSIVGTSVAASGVSGELTSTSSVQSSDGITSKKTTSVTDSSRQTSTAQTAKKTAMPSTLGSESKESTSSRVYQLGKADDQGYINISTPEELLALSENGADLTKNYKLANDIDMTGQAGKVIGKYNNGANGEKVFTGVFDGNGYVIKNIAIGGEALFGYVGTDGVVRNLTLKNAAIEDTVNSSIRYPAALVSNNKGTVEKCYSYGSTVVSKYNSRTGGLVGSNTGTIKQSGVVGGSVHYQSSGTMVGGLVGWNKGTISESFADTNVTGNKWAGGFVGAVEDGSITDCYAMGVVNGNTEIGGFAGKFISPGALTNVYASNDVKATSGGALVGAKLGSYNSLGTIVNVYYNSDRIKPNEEAVAVTAEPKTTEQMQDATFASALGEGWKIDIGDAIINSGYPYLINAAPEPQAPVEKTVKVDMVVATWDNSTYQFVPQAVPFVIEAQGDNVTAEKIMESAKEKAQLEYTTSQNISGAFVKSINGRTLEAPNGWMFTINDKTSSLGISSAPMKTGDKLLWYEGMPANGYKAPLWADITAPVPAQYETIGTKEQLLALMNSSNPTVDWAKNYRLSGNIDLAGVENASPIGTETIPFSGMFNGGGFAISNLTIKRNVGSQNLGLFSVIEGALISNLQVNNATIEGGSKVGILVGVARVNVAREKANLIGNCHVTGTLKATGTSVIKQTDAGGLIGINDGGNKDGKSAYSAIDGCTAKVEVIASTGGADNTESGHVGGFVGWNKGNISFSESNGNVYGGNTTGGFVGSNFGDGNIYDSHASGNVIGGYTTGGFAGSIGMGTSAQRCYSTGNVVAIENSYGYYFGGFVGAASGTVKECVSTGTLTPGWSYNGGFAGSFEGTIWSYKDDLLTLKDCFGNSETSLGTSIKGLGNYIGGTHEATDNAAARIGLGKLQAADKLRDMLAAQAKAEADKTALKQEASKYEERVRIPNSVKENTDITALVAKTKPGETPNNNIQVMYREAGENDYVTSLQEPLGKYKLLQRNMDFGIVEEQVMLLFTQGGEIVAQPVTVELEGAKTTASASWVMDTISKGYSNLSYEGAQSDWSAFDMGIYAGADKVFSSEAEKVSFIKKSIENVRTNNATDYQRLIMMMTALGKNAQQYVDVLAKMPEMYLDTVNAQAFALLAYDAGNYTVPSGAVNTREKAIAYLLKNKNADGGWSFMPGTSEASMTAIAISALAPYKNRPEVSSAITGGVNCLSKLQTPRGGFIYSGEENSNDGAMVVVALTSLGIDANKDARFIKNGNSVYSNLMGFVTKDGGFGYTDNAKADELATEQGFRGLIAYSKFSGSGYNIYKISSALEDWMKPVTGTDSSTDIVIDADTSAVPEGTKIKADKIESGEKFNLVETAIGKDVKKFTLFNIELMDIAGTSIQPNGMVRIGIPIPNEYDRDKLVVYRINDDGSKVELGVTVKGNLAYFETDHFSLYALAEKLAVTETTTTTITTTTTTGTTEANKNPEATENTQVKPGITENKTDKAPSDKIENGTNARGEKVETSPNTGDIHSNTGYIIFMAIGAVCAVAAATALVLDRKRHKE